MYFASCSCPALGVALAAVGRLAVLRASQRAVRCCAVPLPLLEFPGLQRTAVPGTNRGDCDGSIKAAVHG